MNSPPGKTGTKCQSNNAAKSTGVVVYPSEAQPIKLTFWFLQFQVVQLVIDALVPLLRLLTTMS